MPLLKSSMKPLLCILYTILLSTSTVSGNRRHDSTRIVPIIPRGGATDDNAVTNFTFPLFQEGDGHEDDPDSIPGRFIRMQKGNRAKATASLEATLSWRSEKQVDTILGRPHTKYDLCKSVFPHCFLGRDPTDHVIFCQRPGFVDLNLAQEKNVTNEDLLMHYVCVLEYCWNILEPRPDQTMINILDLKGVSFGKTREMLAFVKEFVSMMSSHYPQRSYKTLIINAPHWFGTLFKMISPLLRESTRLKIKISSPGKKQQRVLEECLGSALPEELTSGEPLADSHTLPMEQELREFVSLVLCVCMYMCLYLNL